MPLYKVLSKCFIFINLLSKRNKSLPCKSLSGSPSPYLMEGLDHRVLPAEQSRGALQLRNGRRRRGRAGDRNRQTQQPRGPTAGPRTSSPSRYFSSGLQSRVSPVHLSLAVDGGDLSRPGLAVLHKPAEESRTAARTLQRQFSPTLPASNFQLVKTKLRRLRPLIFIWIIYLCGTLPFL